MSRYAHDYAKALVVVLSLGGGGCHPSGAASSPSPPAQPSVTPRVSATVAKHPSALGELPAIAQLPPAGVTPSKDARVAPDPLLETCLLHSSSAGEPAARVEALGRGCQGTSRMLPVGPPFQGRQADRDSAATTTFRANEGACYRVYTAHESSIRDLVVLARTRDGRGLATSAGPALPEDGALCFTAATEVTIAVSVGSGQGRYAVQVWSR